MGHNGLKRHNKAMVVIYYDVKPPSIKIINLDRIKLRYEFKKLQLENKTLNKNNVEH